ncbi:peptide methionine sulfoxide reductase A5 [Prunus yedoensis var. nudiflora]|uniref:Peptide methionine sulfoxide reductase A5 n=1 Tax=Prunus yedoensis var. nudiflora TaxID=2094558 RepID=A0A314UCG7_PRUYE|nr:peptide methionine sulfoxide reductase A5 [Prunus yedoensis var. nudiflora]
MSPLELILGDRGPLGEKLSCTGDRTTVLSPSNRSPPRVQTLSENEYTAGCDWRGIGLLSYPRCKRVFFLCLGWAPIVQKNPLRTQYLPFPYAKRPRIKRGLISNSTLPHVPSIARLLSAVRFCSVAATSSIRKSHAFLFQTKPMAFLRRSVSLSRLLATLMLLIILAAERRVCIRIPERIIETAGDVPNNQSLKTAVFALGSFWRSEAVFGCLNGVVQTTVGYAGGSKINPEYRSLGDHAESVQVIYDHRLISFKQLLEIFWSSHDYRQVFGQGPDVGNQYRSIIFTNGTEESRLAVVSKEREQTKSKSSSVTTQILPLGKFYSAEPEHQKFELKRRPFLLQLIGNLPEDELERSRLAAKLNGYAAELCPPKIQRQIDAKINEIIKKGWPILRDL